MLKYTSHHCRDCGAAFSVKTLGMRFADGGTGAQRGAAWEITQAHFWRQAEHVAKKCGYEHAQACGRSGGWCAPMPQEHNETSTRRWGRFEKAINRLYDGVPKIFADTLAAIIADDAEEERAEEARMRLVIERPEGFTAHDVAAMIARALGALHEVRILPAEEEAALFLAEQFASIADAHRAAPEADV